MLDKYLRGNKIAPLWPSLGACAKGVQFYCPYRTYPAIPYCTIFHFKPTLCKERMYRCLGLLYEAYWNFNFDSAIEFHNSQCLMGISALIFDTSFDLISLSVFIKIILRLFHYFSLILFLTVLAPL